MAGFFEKPAILFAMVFKVGIYTNVTFLCGGSDGSAH
jgi:hypothetical protein